MDRIIKFRGKRIDNGEWVYGDFAIWQGKCQISNDDTSDNAWTHHVHDVDPLTVGQFTGFHDQNGTPIYEGDTMECYQANENEVIWYWGEWCYRNFHAEALPLGDLGNPYMDEGRLKCTVTTIPSPSNAEGE